MNVNTYWNGVCVVFPFLYQLLKEKKIDWNFFSAAEINRLDLNYLRKIHPSQERLVADFQSEETIRAKGINARINSTKYAEVKQRLEEGVQPLDIGRAIIRY
jgi:hypothetical protein